MEFRLLCAEDQPTIHRAFLHAFADYAVPVQFDADRFARLTARRGAVFDLSVGVFDDGEMVAFMVTAFDTFEGQPTAYDVFTGVAPSHRNRGLAGRMFEFARPHLERRGATRFLLEVIQTNAPAVRAYERTGFTTRRGLHCFELDTDGLRAALAPAGVRIERVETPDWSAWAPLRSWSPSWQNGDRSIARTVEEVHFAQARAGDEVIGYAILVPLARDLPQLAVRPDWRRHGVGRALLGELLRATPTIDRLRAINVDAGAADDHAFFSRWSAEALPSQFEMELPLSAHGDRNGS